MYLKTLELTNFQSHENTKIEFSPFLNCIAGRNNKGKSSILRALDLLYYNEWDTSFVRKGTNAVIVKAVFDNGFAIYRKKGENINVLKIKTDEGVEKWENFGVEIPSKVKNFLGLRPFYLGLDEKVKLNFSEQLESPFLILASGPTKAKAISRLIQLHYFDIVISKFNAESKSLNTECHTLDDDVKSINNKLDEFKQLDTLKIFIDKFEISSLRCKQIINETDSLNKCQEEYELLKDYHSTIASFNEIFDKIDIKKYDDKLSQLQDISILTREFDEIAEQRNEIEQLNRNIDECIINKNLILNNIKTKYKELGLCPFCGSTISDEKLCAIYK